jgi:hypothetical protein
MSADTHIYQQIPDKKFPIEISLKAARTFVCRTADKRKNVDLWRTLSLSEPLIERSCATCASYGLRHGNRRATSAFQDMLAAKEVLQVGRECLSFHGLSVIQYQCSTALRKFSVAGDSHRQIKIGKPIGRLRCHMPGSGLWIIYGR